MIARAAVIVAVAVVLAGCGSQPVVQRPARVSERVILLPSETATPSAVIVKTGDAEVLLNMTYTSVEIRGGALVSSATTAEEVQRRYSGLLSAQPKKPQPFTMYFVLGSDELTPASKVAFEAARRQVASWSAAEIVVIGHADRLGTLEYNDTLSLQRAQMVARRLVSSGVPAEVIEVAARGEREPIVPTADGIPEPRNRRVEIKVR